MPKYENQGGNSGVSSYKSTRGALSIKFKDNSRYTYTPTSSSTYKMRRMRQLASKGIGLNKYINKSVKKGYESKER